jgi:hypothetical protein
MHVTRIHNFIRVLEGEMWYNQFANKSHSDMNLNLNKDRSKTWH